MKRLKQLLLLGLVCFMGFSSIKAQSDTIYKLSLSEAQEFAINNFFVSKNAQLDIESAQKKIWETTAIGLPQVSAGIDYTYMPDIPELSFPKVVMGANKGDNEPVYGGDFRDQNFYQTLPGEPFKMGVTNNVSYNLMLTQIIFSGEYIVGLQASKAYKSFAQENYEKVKINIKEGIAGSYYALLILEKNKIVLEETLENLKLSFEHTAKYFEQGLAEDTDVDQLELTVKRTENSLRTLENQIVYLSKLFNYQIGLEADVSVELKDNIEELISKNIIDAAALSFNLTNHIDYKILLTQENLQNLSYKREKSLFLPSVAGFYKYNDQFEQPDFNTNIKHILGVNVSIPILSSGMRLAKVGQAKIELDKASNMKDQEAQYLIIASQQAQFDYSTSLENYLNEKQNFELSERVYKKTTAKFKEGMVSALDLSLINNQFLQAQLSLTGAIQKLLSAKTNLDKAFNQL
ncbi:MAG: TolC family protein [Salinivirgaceae bacterium]|nr:TolC family protein [Salinivirgaceae bacterium]